MNKNFVWFMGVVEDVHDPKELGRVQVRCIGYHSHDDTKIPTTALPWATVMAPTTSSSFRGVNTPMHGLVVGSTVFGFFLDGTDAQYPMIMGSVPGKAKKTKPNPQTSYALEEQLDNYVPDEADIGTLSQSGAPNTVQGKSFINSLTGAAVTKVNTATPPELSTVDGTGFASSYYTVPTWSLPPARGGSDTASYSFNKVLVSESGHVEERDDTPGNERLMKFHKSGTYQEFDAAGNLVTRIVGDNYEVVLGNDNIFVKGNVNLTVEGNVRQLVLGNYHLEVYGDYTEKIHGTRKAKITGNDLKEIIGYEANYINADKFDTINGKARISIGNGWSQYVAGDYDINVGGLAPYFGVKTTGLPGIGLIQMESNGTVDILGQLGAAIKGVITTIGDPTIPLSTTNINGKTIQIGVLDTTTIITTGNPLTTALNSVNGTVIALDAMTSITGFAATNVDFTSSAIILDGVASVTAVAPVINLN